MSRDFLNLVLPEGVLTIPEAIEAFNRRFVEVVESREVFDLLTGDRMSHPDFKTNFRHKRCVLKEGSAKTKLATDVWLDDEEHQRYYRYTYAPGEDLFANHCVNLWRDLSPSPHTGDISPWTALENHVFCDLSQEEKHWVRCWMAYPLQHPGTKLHTALLIYSPAQGVGKGLITETLKVLYGIHTNDSFSNSGTIGNRQLQSGFNAWIARRQLIICDEISVPYKDREVVGERLKSLITEHSVTVNEKYRREVDFPNFANFIITTNSPAAVKIEDGDRRYFVISCSAPQLDPAFARQFISWRDFEPDAEDDDAPTPGLNALMHYFLTYDTTGFDPYAPAPVTSGKAEVIENSSAPHEVWLRDLKTQLDRYPDLVTIQELYNEYRDGGGDTFVSATTFSSAMSREGFTQASRNGIPIDGGTRSARLRVLKNHDLYRSMTDANKGRAYDAQRMARGTPIQANVPTLTCA